MGRDKATLEVDGVAMAARVAGALRRAGAVHVAAVGGDRPALEQLGLSVVPDDEPGEGPLPATLTALRHARGDPVVVLSCDLVAPNPEAVAGLVERLAAAAPDVLGAVPLVDGHPQWTHAAWRRSALAALEAAQRTGARSLRAACADLHLLYVPDVAPADVADADHPRDLPGDR